VATAVLEQMKQLEKQLLKGFKTKLFKSPNIKQVIEVELCFQQQERKVRGSQVNRKNLITHLKSLA
jgi:hypothetical protein